MEGEEVRGADDEGVGVNEEVKGGSATCVCLEAEKD